MSYESEDSSGRGDMERMVVGKYGHKKSSKIPADPLTKKLKFVDRILLKQMMKHRCATPFLKPVDPIALGIPDYFNIIARPMDLSTIKKKLAKKAYHDVQSCLDDFELMFANCYKFNGTGEVISEMCLELENLFRKKVTLMPGDSHSAVNGKVKGVKMKLKVSHSSTAGESIHYRTDMSNEQSFVSLQHPHRANRSIDTSPPLSNILPSPTLTTPHRMSARSSSTSRAVYEDESVHPYLQSSLSSELTVDVSENSDSPRKKKGVKRKADTTTSAAAANTFPINDAAAPAGHYQLHQEATLPVNTLLKSSVQPMTARRESVRSTKRAKKESAQDGTFQPTDKEHPEIRSMDQHTDYYRDMPELQRKDSKQTMSRRRRGSEFEQSTEQQQLVHEGVEHCEFSVSPIARRVPPVSLPAAAHNKSSSTIKSAKLLAEMKLFNAVIKEFYSKRGQMYASPFYELSPPGSTINAGRNKGSGVAVRPMDLETIKTKLERGDYGLTDDAVDEFAADVQLIVSNCCRSSPTGSELVSKAKKLKTIFDRKYARMLQELKTDNNTTDGAIKPSAATIEFEDRLVESEERDMNDDESSDSGDSSMDDEMAKRSEIINTLRAQVEQIQKELQRVSEEPSRPKKKKKKLIKVKKDKNSKQQQLLSPTSAPAAVYNNIKGEPDLSPPYHRPARAADHTSSYLCVPSAIPVQSFSSDVSPDIILPPVDTVPPSKVPKSVVTTEIAQKKTSPSKRSGKSSDGRQRRTPRKVAATKEVGDESVVIADVKMMSVVADELSSNKKESDQGNVSSVIVSPGEGVGPVVEVKAPSLSSPLKELTQTTFRVATPVGHSLPRQPMRPSTTATPKPQQPMKFTATGKPTSALTTAKSANTTAATSLLVTDDSIPSDTPSLRCSTAVSLNTQVPTSPVAEVVKAEMVSILKTEAESPHKIPADAVNVLTSSTRAALTKTGQDDKGLSSLTIDPVSSEITKRTGKIEAEKASVFSTMNILKSPPVSEGLHNNGEKTPTSHLGTFNNFLVGSGATATSTEDKHHKSSRTLAHSSPPDQAVTRHHPAGRQRQPSSEQLSPSADSIKSASTEFKKSPPTVSGLTSIAEQQRLQQKQQRIKHESLHQKTTSGKTEEQRLMSEAVGTAAANSKSTTQQVASPRQDLKESVIVTPQTFLSQHMQQQQAGLSKSARQTSGQQLDRSAAARVRPNSPLLGSSSLLKSSNSSLSSDTTVTPHQPVSTHGALFQPAFMHTPSVAKQSCSLWHTDASRQPATGGFQSSLVKPQSPLLAGLNPAALKRQSSSLLLQQPGGVELHGSTSKLDPPSVLQHSMSQPASNKWNLGVSKTLSQDASSPKAIFTISPPILSANAPAATSTNGASSSFPSSSQSSSSTGRSDSDPAPIKKETKIKNVNSWSKLASMGTSNTPGSSGMVKKSSAMQSFEQFRKQAKEKEEREKASQEQEMRRLRQERENAERLRQEQEPVVLQRPPSDGDRLARRGSGANIGGTGSGVSRTGDVVVQNEAKQEQVKEPGVEDEHERQQRNAIEKQKEIQRLREQERRRRAASAMQIDMNAQSEVMASFEYMFEK